MVPLSGFTGDNLTSPSRRMPWWSGVPCPSSTSSTSSTSSGSSVCLSLLEVLDRCVTPPDRTSLIDQPLVIPLSGVMKISGIGTVVTGRVEQGTAVEGEHVCVRGEPIGSIRSLETHHTAISTARPGDLVGLAVKGAAVRQIHSLIGHTSGGVLTRQSEFPRELLQIATFTCQVIVLKPCSPLKVGFECVGFARTSRASVRLERIHWAQDWADRGEKGPTDQLQARQKAEVTFRCLANQPFDVMCFHRVEGMGRVIFIDCSDTTPHLVMAGRVLSTTPTE